jgi:hypothetical protein
LFFCLSHPFGVLQQSEAEAAVGSDDGGGVDRQFDAAIASDFFLVISSLLYCAPSSCSQ